MKKKCKDCYNFVHGKCILDECIKTKLSNEEYLQSKIYSAKDAWKGVDVDEYMNMVRGRDC